MTKESRNSSAERLSPEVVQRSTRARQRQKDLRYVHSTTVAELVFHCRYISMICNLTRGLGLHRIIQHVASVAMTIHARSALPTKRVLGTQLQVRRPLHTALQADAPAVVCEHADAFRIAEHVPATPARLRIPFPLHAVSGSVMCEAHLRRTTALETASERCLGNMICLGAGRCAEEWTSGTWIMCTSDELCFHQSATACSSHGACAWLTHELSCLGTGRIEDSPAPRQSDTHHAATNSRTVCTSAASLCSVHAEDLEHDVELRVRHFQMDHVFRADVDPSGQWVVCGAPMILPVCTSRSAGIQVERRSGDDGEGRFVLLTSVV